MRILTLDSFYFRGEGLKHCCNPTQRQVLGLILDTRCVLKSNLNKIEMAEVPFKNTRLIARGMFLHEEWETNETLFFVWSYNGAATLYNILSIDGEI